MLFPKFFSKKFPFHTGLISKIDTNDESISLVKSQLEGLSVAVRALEKDVEKLEDKNTNPLAN